MFSHDPVGAPLASEEIKKALGKQVALDTTAAATLALLDSEVQDQLIGAFSVIKATTPAYKDALQAQQSFRLRSTMTIAWNTEEQDLVRYTITEEEADRLAQHSDRTVAIFERANHKSWQEFKRLKDYGEHTAWLTTLDYALTNEVAFWCDDLGLRLVALQEGQPTFGTVDLLRSLADAGKIFETQREIAESILISNYHVDLDSSSKVWRLAAQIDGWKAEGTSAILTRPSSWQDSHKALALLGDGILNNAEASPEIVRIWVANAAIGLVAITGNHSERSSHNLGLLLRYCLIQSWKRPDLFSFMLQGIRQAIPPSSAISDPLEDVLRSFHMLFHEEFGPIVAKVRLFEFVRHLDESDKHLASRIVLTYPSDP